MTRQAQVGMVEGGLAINNDVSQIEHDLMMGVGIQGIEPKKTLEIRVDFVNQIPTAQLGANIKASSPVKDTIDEPMVNMSSKCQNLGIDQYGHNQSIGAAIT